MCCRMTVLPMQAELLRTLLQVGLFNTRDGIVWERIVTEEMSKVTATLNTDGLELSISPSISTYEHHLNKRITGSIYFEIAAKYAEKVGGEIIQQSNVQGCRVNGNSALLIASYPGTPMTYERVCTGFQEILLGSL